MFRENIVKQYEAQYAEQVKAQLEPMGQAQLAGALVATMPSYTTEQCAVYHDNVLVFSESDYESNLLKLGCIDLDKPSRV